MAFMVEELSVEWMVVLGGWVVAVRGEEELLHTIFREREAPSRRERQLQRVVREMVLLE